MISRYSLRLVRYVIWFNSLICLTQTSWDKKKQRFKTRDSFLVPLVTFGNICGRIIAIIYLSVFAFFEDLPIDSWDFRLCIIWLGDMMMTTPLYIWQLYCKNFWTVLLNQTLGFNKNLAKFHDQPRYVKRDGLERIATITIIITSIIVIFGPFIATLILYIKDPAVTRTLIHIASYILNVSILIATAFAGLTLAYGLMYDSAFMVMLVISGMLYVNCTKCWLQKHTWTMEIFRDTPKRQEMRLLFRQIQIPYKWAYEQFIRRTNFGLTTIAANLLIMFCLFFFIRSLDSDDHIFLNLLGVITVLMMYILKLSFESLNDVTVSSLCYSQSLHAAVPKISKYEVLYLKGCSPFKWNFGGLLTIDHQTFVWMMTEFTISELISMLQAF